MKISFSFLWVLILLCCLATPLPSLAQDKVVLAGFTESFKWMNNPTQSGNYRSTFFSDGKLQDMALYSDTQATTPLAETKFTYYPNSGVIHTIEEYRDENADGTYDKKNTLTNIWDDAHNRLSQTNWVSANVNALPGDFLLQTQTGYFYPGDIAPNYVKDGQSVAGTGVVDANQNGLWSDAELSIWDNDLLQESRMVIYLPADPNNSSIVPQFTAELKKYTYDDQGKPLTLTHTYYFCPDQYLKICNYGNPGVIPSSDYVQFPPVDFDPHAPELTPYYKTLTTWTYNDTDGKLSRLDIQFDGYPDAKDSRAVVNGWDTKLTCNIDYYDNPTGEVIAAFPREMKELGLSESDKIKSLNCNDNGAGIVSISFQFNDWRSLQDVIGSSTTP